MYIFLADKFCYQKPTIACHACCDIIFYKNRLISSVIVSSDLKGGITLLESPSSWVSIVVLLNSPSSGVVVLLTFRNSIKIPLFTLRHMIDVRTLKKHIQ